MGSAHRGILKRIFPSNPFIHKFLYGHYYWTATFNSNWIIGKRWPNEGIFIYLSIRGTLLPSLPLNIVNNSFCYRTCYLCHIVNLKLCFNALKAVAYLYCSCCPKTKLYKLSFTPGFLNRHWMQYLVKKIHIKVMTRFFI